ncbi:winged helix-turn-helix domain-containing protein [Paenibacillus sediminis]|uniref:Two-component system alkaline phosphatase synthesis response regulator PhoP n=1 Tax=Paenibacillus sediminis TaxID=664909 RepID=A0ABS4H2K9_9BACL|nr:winged helix-turn-helix domain-containing protein [Paenibacillus sediminis]MBP1936754.1 two-component system alkaline phosphatase synthesis response regulator PhoP [Paenibacillus sediminis]
MSNQTNQVKLSLSGNVVPISAPYHHKEKGQSEPSAEVCPITQRVVLISSRPSEIHELVRSLSERCFDVLVFHRFEPDIQFSLAADLIVFDMTTDSDEHVYTEYKTLFGEQFEGVPSLLLVNEQMISEHEDELMEEELLIWPAREKEVIYHVNRLIRSGSKDKLLSGADQSIHRTVYKDLWIDRSKMTVHQNQAPVDLTKTEYELLLKLIDGKGSVISREMMMNDIWGTHFLGGSNVVDVHVKSLRKKLGDSPTSPKYIVTVRGVGYRLAD